MRRELIINAKIRSKILNDTFLKRHLVVNSKLLLVKYSLLPTLILVSEVWRFYKLIFASLSGRIKLKNRF